MWRQVRACCGSRTTRSAAVVSRHWRSTQRHRTRSGGRPHTRHPQSFSRDAAGMVVPESVLQVRHISPSRFDRELAAAAEAIVGDVEGDGESGRKSHASGTWSGIAGVNLGAQMDQRLVRHRGKQGDVRTLSRASLPSTTAQRGGRGAASVVDESASVETPASMRSVRAHVDAHHSGAHAYVRSTASPSGKQRPSGGSATAAPRVMVELDDGEKVAAPTAPLSVLQRVLRQSRVGGNAANSVLTEAVLGAATAASLERNRAAAEAGGGSAQAAQLSVASASERAARRTEKAATREHRRERAAERLAVSSATQQHPCLLQGDSAHHKSSVHAHMDGAACTFAQSPSVSCLHQLRHGHCPLHAVHGCPWHHGDAASHRRATVLAEVLFASDSSEPAMMEVTQRRIPQQAALADALLQLFVDLLAVRVENWHRSRLTSSSPDQHGEHGLATMPLDTLCAAIVPTEEREGDTGHMADATVEERDADLRARPTSYQDMPAQLSVPLSLATTALELCASAGSNKTPSGSVEEGTSPTDLEASFEDMWTAAEREEPPSGADFGHAQDQAVEEAELFLESTSCLWSSFFITQLGEGELRLNPALTHWAVHEARQQYLLETRHETSGSGGGIPAAHNLLTRASAALLTARLHACEQLWSGHAGTDTASHSATSHPSSRWAPLLLLKDCLLLQACPSGAATAAEAAEAAAGLDAAPRGGSLLSDLLCLPHSPLAEASPTPPRHTLHQSQEALEQGWHRVHHVLLSVVCGLAQQANSVTPAAEPLRAEGSLTLLAFTQASVVELAAHCSAALGDLFEDRLRRERGWMPWTDALMFDASRNALYSPSEYVRHHMPVVAAASMNALLNGFLLLTTHATTYQHGLEVTSPFADLLGLSAGQPVRLPAVAPARGDADAWVPWIHARRQRRHRHAMAGALQTEVQVSLVFLSALQQHSEAVLAQQAALKQAYQQRLYSYRRAQEDGEHAPDNRTRRYHHTQLSDVESVVEEAEEHDSIVNRLLPHGSAAVSAAAVAPLLRLLLESRHNAFKALRLSVTAMRVSRLLRHAAALPDAIRVQTSKLVHRRVWSRKLGKKVLVTTRVPVVRWERPEELDARRSAATTAAEKSQKKMGQGVKKRDAAVQPVGLLFHLDEHVAAEMCRSGLRMGEAGLALADGVRNDCFAGGMMEYGETRCLPVLSLEALRQALQTPLAPHQSAPCRYTRACVEQCLRVAGLTAASRVRQQSHDQLHAEAAPALVGRRVPPTNALMEILESHTPAADTARQAAYDVQWCRDPPLFTSAATVFARHVRVALQQPLWAVQAYEVVWSGFAQQRRQDTHTPSLGGTTAGAQTAPLAVAWRAVWQEVDRRWEAVQAVLLEARSPRSKVTAAHGGTDMAHVKALLQGNDDGDAAAAAEQPVRAATPQPGKPHRRTAGHHASPCTPGARYELRLYEDWQQATRPDEVMWSASAATLASLTPALVRGPHSANPAVCTARQALLHIVLLATLTPRQDDAHAFVAHACRCLLLSPLLEAGAGEGALARDTASAPEDKRGQTLWPVHSVVIRAVPLFLALQVALWETCAGSTTEAESSLARVVGAQPDVASLTPSLHSHPAWLLMEPLGAHPDLARRWLTDTFFSPSPSLVSWLVAQCHDTDPHTRTALANWLQAISDANKALLPPPLVRAMLAELPPCRPSRHVSS